MHHVIFISSTTLDTIFGLHKQCREVFGSLASAVVRSEHNLFFSFFIAPDGSKDEWTISRYYDKQRDGFFAWLKEDCELRGFNVVEVAYNKDEAKTIRSLYNE